MSRLLNGLLNFDLFSVLTKVVAKGHYNAASLVSTSFPKSESLKTLVSKKENENKG